MSSRSGELATAFLHHFSMIATTEPKRQILDKRNAALIKAVNVILNDFTLNTHIEPCKDFHPQCTNCRYYEFLGHLHAYKRDLEYH